MEYRRDFNKVFPSLLRPYTPLSFLPTFRPLPHGRYSSKRMVFHIHCPCGVALCEAVPASCRGFVEGSRVKDGSRSNRVSAPLAGAVRCRCSQLGTGAREVRATELWAIPTVALPYAQPPGPALPRLVSQRELVGIESSSVGSIPRESLFRAAPHAPSSSTLHHLPTLIVATSSRSCQVVVL